MKTISESVSAYKPNTDLILRSINEELGIPAEQVKSTVDLILEGGTVPFIARYRKERTGGLDEVQIRDISEKLVYYSELEQRKETVLNSIESQDKLTEELKGKILKCRENRVLEDLYLPFKPKKRTKATIAREKGLDALVALLLKQPELDGTPVTVAGRFVSPEKGVNSVEEALEGAADIMAEVIIEDAEIREWVRKYFEQNGLIATRPRREWEGRKSKFEMYYDFREYIKESPSHRLLAIRRGANERVLSWKIEVDQDDAIRHLESKYLKNRDFIFIEYARKAVRAAWARLSVTIEFEVFSGFMRTAEEEAIGVFSTNLNNLLLEPPAGHKVIMGIDPGFRTGCKVAVIDKWGAFKEYLPIYPHSPQKYTKEAADALRKLIDKYKVELIAIGNGTASRETMIFVRETVERFYGKDIGVVMVSESGASVYSASPKAIEEFPDLDVTVRGAISIARRLQDPLSELVKIDPKAIGVGQYQHDVNQSYLKRSLRSVVESCVNYVGVELNTSSKELLTYVAGVGPVLAGKIVEHREKNGPFRAREDLKNVFMLGEKAFEQCAGFLRIRNSADPLDNSAIHPESYHVVESMARDLSTDVAKLIGQPDKIREIDKEHYVDEKTGLPTINDILLELEKPGLDPRKKFESVEFRDDIKDVDDLKADMKLFGKVTNVTNFGAFVDIGVHQDGLVHISNLSRKFVNDPHEVVAVGDKVRVRVISVDRELGRIDLERIS